MKYLNNILHVEMPDLLKCGFDEKNIHKGVSSGYSTLPCVKDKGRLVFPLENLGDRYKEAIEKVFGNPHEYMAKQPILKMVSYDEKAEAYYLSKGLGLTQAQELAKAASWLNMIIAMYADKKFIKKTLNLTLDVFNDNVISLIKTENIDLPQSNRRLFYGKDSVLAKYKEHGYESLIHGNTGKKNAAKIDDEVSESLILELLSHPNQYDDVYISMAYNMWATQNNKKTISSQTIGLRRRDNEAYIISSRNGNAAFYDKYMKQVKGFRPTAPTLLWESDDNHIDLLFEDPNDSTTHKYFHKYKAIVVTDSFNDMVCGYAYSENMSVELVKAAYMNAMYYMRSLTGYWILPSEVKTDRWAIKGLEPFYHQLGNYFKTPVGSKNRGYIENFFGSPHWKRCLKIGANNYSGNNMSAKYRGVNTDVLDMNIKNRPLIGSTADDQVEQFFYRLRNMPLSNGQSKKEQWLAAWQSLPVEQKRIITDEQFLLKFGVVHNPNNPRTITNRGCEPEINGIQYSYDLPDNIRLMDYVGLKVNVVYDPYDMSRVLLTDFDKIRIIAKDARINSRALADATINSRTYLNAILAEKRDDVDHVTSKASKRKQVLLDAGLTAEAILQSGTMDKQLKQYGESYYPTTKQIEERKQAIEEWQQKDDEYMDENVNFNEFFKQQ